MSNYITTAYLSHPIRGAKREKATREDMEANNKRAIWMASVLRAIYPNLDIYCPADHDEFVVEAYFAENITEDGILRADCEILKKRDMLLVYNWDGHISNGMKIEIGCAIENKIPMIMFKDIPQAIKKLDYYLL